MAYYIWALVVVFYLWFRCLYETQVLPRIFFACTKYLQLEQIETPMGLLTRLVLGNQMFVEQFAQAVHDFKVYRHAFKNMDLAFAYICAPFLIVLHDINISSLTTQSGSIFTHWIKVYCDLELILYTSRSIKVKISICINLCLKHIFSPLAMTS